MPKAVIAAKEVARVFRWSSDEERTMRAQLARACVLYEDLRIEDLGALADSIPELDHTSLECRRFYFVRRTLATLQEVRSVMNVLNQNSLFQSKLPGWPPEAKDTWDKARAFFEGPDKDFLKAWRNDFGGHFQTAAAEFAIADINPDDVGLCELYKTSGSGADARMKFAWDLLSVALGKDRPQEQSEADFTKEAFGRLRDAHYHAFYVIQTLVLLFVWPRFVGEDGQ